MNEQIDLTSAKVASAKGRSPLCPCIGLEEAVSKLRLLYDTAKNHEVLIEGVVSEVWESNIQTAKRIAGSLEHYGLAERNNGKIKISSRGMTVLIDERPGERDRSLADAAVQHPLLNEYICKWGSTRPQDKICMSELQLEKSFTESGAKEFLKVYDETVKYAVHQKTNANSILQLPADTRNSSLSPLKSVSSSSNVSDTVEAHHQSINHDIESAYNNLKYSSKNPFNLMSQLSDLLKQFSVEDRNTAIRWIQEGHI